MSGLDLLSPEHRRLFIGGTWREANSGATFVVRDPADGSVITEVSDGDVNDAVDALDAAVAVQDEWGRTPPRERGEILRRSFELITQRADDFAVSASLGLGRGDRLLEWIVNGCVAALAIAAVWTVFGGDVVALVLGQSQGQAGPGQAQSQPQLAAPSPPAMPQ